VTLAAVGGEWRLNHQFRRKGGEPPGLATHSPRGKIMLVL